LFCNTEKAHPCAESRRLTILRENRFGGFSCGSLEESGKKKSSKHFWCAISRIRRTETPWGIV